MAESVTVKERFKRIVEGLWPQGIAWRQVRESDSKLSKINCLIASEVQLIDQRTKDIIKEANPKSSFEMLDDWEKFLGIPDECTPEDQEQTLSDRRTRICQKLTTGGGQSPQFYTVIAEQLGYDSSEFSITEFNDFRVGKMRVGDKLTNGINTPATGWANTFAVVAPASLVQKFRVGQSTVGERLIVISNETLECVIKKFKPAHVNVLFSFGGDL